jgi:glycosyl transferase family 25
MSISLSKYIRAIKNNNNTTQSIISIIAIIIIACIIIAIILYKPKLTRLFESFQDNTPKSFVDLIDKFVYINLDKREDRKKEILHELELLTIPPEKIQRIAGVYIPKNGHKGCIQSHILAIKLAQMNNWSNVAIFEDDAQMVDNPEKTITVINNAIAELPEKWDVLMLATANKKEENLSDKKHINKLNASTTSSAYIVNGKYYDKLIKLFEYSNVMMSQNKWGKNDGHEPYALDQKWMELQEQDNWFCAKKDLFTQRDSKSTINSRGEN